MNKNDIQTMPGDCSPFEDTLENCLEDMVRNSINNTISKTILESLEGVFKNTSAIPKKPLTKKDLHDLVESLKPKQIVITSSQEIYDGLLLLPKFNAKNVILSKVIEGTIIVDTEYTGKYNIPPDEIDIGKPYLTRIVGLGSDLDG